MVSKTSCAGLCLIVFSVTDLAYNIALCYYSLKQYASALKYIAEIIERGIREHPGMCNRKSFKMCDVIQLISINDSYVYRTQYWNDNRRH